MMLLIDQSPNYVHSKVDSGFSRLNISQSCTPLNVDLGPYCKPFNLHASSDNVLEKLTIVIISNMAMYTLLQSAPIKL